MNLTMKIAIGIIVAVILLILAEMFFSDAIMEEFANRQWGAGH